MRIGKTTALLFVVVIMLSLVSCGKKAEDTMASLDCDEVTIEFFSSRYEQEDVLITDRKLIDRITETFLDISVRETSKPMDFPRFKNHFLKDGSVIEDWFIDNSSVTSGSLLSLGNHEITNDVSAFDYINEIYLSAVQKNG